jgi:hypothetical protein
MPVQLDATVGGESANAYDTVENADLYFGALLHGTVWTAELDADKKKRALISATARIEEEAFQGQKASLTQRLQHPRSYLEDPDTGCYVPETIIVRGVIEAMFDHALDLLTQTNDPGRRDPLSRFKSLALPGGIKIEMRDGAPSTNDVLRPSALRKLAPYLLSGDTVRIDRSS